MTTAAVFGSTGAVGSHILDALIASESYVSIKTISRHLPRVQSSRLEAILEADASKWGGGGGGALFPNGTLSRASPAMASAPRARSSWWA